MLGGAEREDAFLGAGFFLIAPGAAKGDIELVLIKRLFQGLRLHDVGMARRAMRERTDAGINAFLVRMDDQVHTNLGRLAIAEFDHFAKLPGRIDMHQRERRHARIEGLHRQMQHHRAVFADRIEHDRVFSHRRHFANNVNGLSFKPIEMR